MLVHRGRFFLHQLIGSDVLEKIKIGFALIIIFMGLVSLSTDYFLTPYMLLGLGILHIIDAKDLYKENKKIHAFIMLAVSILVIIVGVLILLKS